MKKWIAAATLAATIVPVVTACASPSNREGVTRRAEKTTVVKFASQPTNKWLINDLSGSQRQQSNPQNAAPANGTHPSLTKKADGKYAAFASNLGRQLLGAGYVQTSKAEFEGLDAGQASFKGTDSSTATVVVQKLRKPLSLSTITLGSRADTRSQLADGAQVISVNHAPGVEQTIIVTAHGTSITITVNGTSPGTASGQNPLTSSILNHGLTKFVASNGL